MWADCSFAFTFTYEPWKINHLASNLLPLCFAKFEGSTVQLDSHVIQFKTDENVY